MKVLFLINSLGGGGAQKVLVNLVNNMDCEKYDITVETMFGDGINAKDLKPHIKYISKNAPCPKGISYLLKLVPARLLYKYFVGKADYDVLIAYIHGVPVKVICGNKKAKKIAWIHNSNPESSMMFTPWITQNRAFKDYALCDAIVGVCKSVADAFSDYTGLVDNVHVAFNTLDVNHILEQAHKSVDIEIDSNRINIVSVGRLGKEKGYSRLIDVCKMLKNEGHSFRLYLVGTGVEETILKNKVAELELKDEIIFLGFQENPYKYVSKCDIFVCSSFTEGLSTATIEALILGKAIISTDVSGAREILGDNKYGLVVENSNDGIYCGLKSLLSDSDLLTKLQELAKKRKYVFSIDNTVKQVEKVLINLK